VLVTVRATLTAADGKQALQRVFNHREPVADNRVSLIVAAYDKAVDETLAEVVDWTDAAAPGLGPAGAPPSRSLPQSLPDTQ
jgi:cholesterol transport system auxiliary component